MVQSKEIQGEYVPKREPRVIFGQDCLEKLRGEIESMGGKKALLLTGRTLAEKTDAASRVSTLLGNTCVGVYSGLVQRTPLPAAIEATSLALQKEADTLISLGGTSVSDGAKMIAVMMAEGITDGERLKEYTRNFDTDGLQSLKDKQLPRHIVIPTTLSAGEFNVSGNLLDFDTMQRPRIDDPILFPNLVFLDPQITMNTPDWLWLSTGIKALDHCIERLYGQGSHPVVDATALGGTELIFRYLPRSAVKHKDMEARLQCQIAAWLSMTGTPNVTSGSGLSHAIGHQLGMRYQIPHGYTSCVAQPYVMEFNRAVTTHAQARFARAAGADVNGMSDEAAAIQGARAVDELILGLGLPHRIRDLKVAREDLRSLAEQTIHDRGGRNNPIPVTTADQVMKVLEAAW